ncbi:MAG: replication-relaxation family protein [Actinobacteria bacterium]|nr:replication-relaxation family protein [Actinomycetota bacterium]
MTPQIDGRIGSVALKRTRTFDVSILDHLTDRDTQICTDIYEHRFLTTRQIFQLHFRTENRAQERTRQLFESRVLNRFRPPVYPGSLPWHYILDRLGAEIVMGALNVEPKIYFERNRAERLVKSRRLQHIREINDFFCSLSYAGRRSGTGRLSEWLGEYRSSKECARIVFPDAIATFEGQGAKIRFFFELDRGTERESVIKHKIWGYDEVTPSEHLPRVLLFVFPTNRRELWAHDKLVLYSSHLTVATSTLERHLANPLGRNWLPVLREQRLSLLELEDRRDQ